MQNTNHANTKTPTLDARLPKFQHLISAIFKNLKYGKINIVWADGGHETFNGSEPLTNDLEATLHIHNNRFFRRVIKSGSLGFAESYMEGEWTTPNLAALLELLSRNIHAFENKIGKSRIIRLLQRLVHVMRPNTRKGAEKNIHAHYDLGNDFYELWLDPSMTYSAAYFSNQNFNLEQAQGEKYRNLAEMIDLKPEHHVLEIGCGWGGFAEFAAREIGCKITGITISKEQLAYAKERMVRQNLTGQVDLQYTDYRDVHERYDRIVSIEMFEAVGETYWETYFKQIKNCLKTGGKAGLQIITINNDAFEKYRKRTDFIQKYIFPGGMLPSTERLQKEFNKANLHLMNKLDLGIDYANTLAKWDTSFHEKWQEIKKLGFDQKFKNLWHYYLAYCEAGFRTKHIDVSQFVLENKSN